MLPTFAGVESPPAKVPAIEVVEPNSVQETPDLKPKDKASTVSEPTWTPQDDDDIEEEEEESESECEFPVAVN